MQDNIPAENSSASAAPSTQDSSSPDLSPASFGQSAKNFLSDRERARNTRVDDNHESSTAADEAKSATDTGNDHNDLSKDQEKATPPRLQKRIDRLTQRYHESERKLAQSQVMIQRLEKAVELLQKEGSRIASKARLDPQQEKIRELELRNEIDQYTNTLQGADDRLFDEGMREYHVQTRTEEIMEEVAQATHKYDLARPEAVLILMRDEGLGANAAARKIHEDQLLRAKRHVTQSPPRTLGTQGNTSTAPMKTEYNGVSTIANYLKAREAERTGILRN